MLSIICFIVLFIIEILVLIKIHVQQQIYYSSALEFILGLNFPFLNGNSFNINFLYLVV